MKKVYLTVGVALVSVGAFAQARHSNTVKAANHPKGVVSVAQPTAGAPKAGGACLFSEDFEGGAIPNGWSIGDPVEQQDDDSGVGAGTFVPGWIVGDATVADAGGYFPVPDEPTGNLFAMANDDADPCNCDLSDAGLVTPAIDLTGMSNVGIQFRAFNDGFGAGASTVQVSTDGGVSFTDVNTIPENTVWQTLTVSLDAYSNMSDVRVRFKFDDGGAWVSGLAIDDVCVKELPANDITLAAAFISNVGAGYEDYDNANLEYTFMPLEQALPMVFAGSVTNNGGSEQTDIVLSATVDGNTYTSDPYPSLGAGESDTIYIFSSYTPSVGGDKSVELSVASAEGNDATPSDNSKTRTFYVSEPSCSMGSSVMGTDGDNLTNLLRMSTDTADYGAVGNKFQIGVNNSFAYGIGVVLYGAQTHIGAPIDAFLLSDSPDGLNTVANSDEHFITDDDVSAAGGNHILYIPFDAVLSDPNVIPAPLDMTLDYVGMVETSGADDVAVGLSGVTQPGGFWAYDNGDATTYQFIGTGNKAAMVRLFLADYSVCAGIPELGASNANATLGANMPNPFTGLTTISYTLKTANTVTLDIQDMTGHLVMSKPQGKKGAGSYLIDLDGTPLAQGVYTYTLTVGQERLTRRMVVTK